MIGIDEIDFLHYLVRTQYSKQGSIIEFGPLGGASTCALAAGAPEATLHAYDFWTYHEALRDYFPGRRLRPGQSVLPAFLENIRPFRDRVRVHRGDLTRQRWGSGPIEIVFVDAAKTPASLLHMFREFFPS
ncbi:MAG TPA: class I SAM-dependent methyltransferase, partial [Bryobacteraceae bacterium]|nr:class I SAM-dependent methyltransferase [Bryobacteraceae bacterium]